MSETDKAVGRTVTQIVEDAYLAFRDLPGFRGVDHTLNRATQGGGTPPRLRLHMTARRALVALPASFRDVPLEVVEASYDAPMRSETLPATPHMTGGAGCSAVPGDRGPGGQVTLMVCERTTGRPGFLTGLAAFGGGAGPSGSPVFRSSSGASQGGPVATVAATCCSRAGAAAFATFTGGPQWLPIERPDNLALTSLRQARPGDVLRASSAQAFVEGVGIYRIFGKDGQRLDIDGFQMRSLAPQASGALVFDEKTWSAVGMALASGHPVNGAVPTVCADLARIMAALHLRFAGYDDLIHELSAQTSHSVARPNMRRIDSMLGDPRDIVASGPLAGIEPLGGNRRPDIATRIWPPLRNALQLSSLPKPRGITDRIERLDPSGGARAKIASAVNRSAELSKLGLRGLTAMDFEGCVTFDQVCERIADILEALVEQNRP